MRKIREWKGKGIYALEGRGAKAEYVFLSTDGEEALSKIKQSKGKLTGFVYVENPEELLYRDMVGKLPTIEYWAGPGYYGSPTDGGPPFLGWLSSEDLDIVNRLILEEGYTHVAYYISYTVSISLERAVYYYGLYLNIRPKISFSEYMQDKLNHSKDGWL